MFKVLQTDADGKTTVWATTENGVETVETFESREDAQVAITEFIRLVDEEIEAGQRSTGSGYTQKNFRIEEALP
jgi:hypothetical protein